MADTTIFFPSSVGQSLVLLARKTIMEHLGLQFPAPEGDATSKALASSAAGERHGVFVTLTIDNQLRGCIGTLSAEESVLEGVRGNAINAAFGDPRFPPLSRAEVERVAIEVSVLSEPRALPYAGADDLLARLRPGIDGVILSVGYRSATFLPQVWSQLPDPIDFLSHLCLKAGLARDTWRSPAVNIKTYQVQHFSDVPPCAMPLT
jgi:AmmeMemoRadiSam system protein A